MRLAVCAAVVAVSATSQDAKACVPIDPGLTMHELDPAQAGDTVAPPAPQVDFSIARGETGGGGCVGVKTDCDGPYANIYVDVTASDDASPTERLGYILSVNGDTPTQLYSAAGDGHTWEQARGSFEFGFDHNDHDFSFDLTVRVVDLNGNTSEPTVIHIEQHENSGGCSTSGPRSEWLLIPVLGFVLRRRRRC